MIIWSNQKFKPNILELLEDGKENRGVASSVTVIQGPFNVNDVMQIHYPPFFKRDPKFPVISFWLPWIS
ncbi:hypothetical protein HYFRA_00010144 [Hymenoscyphus fraxineus]|uniref:Uncharacterized protein n=1 Tax=Hymenoscyphus fraxineus TaxID=746836 RepID=A0A9N9KTL6_9HELO|nr:hypothetical protein HYFRA_00010144 [Hymenoscyphus fraxineus]